MNPHTLRVFAGTTFALALLGGAGAVRAAEPPPVQLWRTPQGGIQPQAAVDSRGVVHLLFYKGTSQAGDLFHARLEPGTGTFSDPIPVNSRPRSAIAGGTIRGAQLAIGREGRVHVAWNGPAPAKGAWMDAPMLYTRLNDAGTAFEPERNLITTARGLDGGGSVAADARGNVYVLWHAPRPGSTNGEAGRAVFVARSTDDGRTFAPERPATGKLTGACGCCGMKALADARGNVLALYRAAAERVNRDQVLLISRPGTADFNAAFTHPWKVAVCPMSSASLSDTPVGVLAAWETDGQVYFARVDPGTGTVSPPRAPSGRVRRKYPVALGNARGETLLAWVEGANPRAGGAVAWQQYDPDGRPAEKGRAEGVPANSLVTAFTRPDGGFGIVY